MAAILAVFDDLLLGSNFTGALSAAGHDVTLAGTAEKAAAEAEAGQFALALVDLNAHGFDGVAVGEGLGAAVKRLGVFAHTDTATRERALAAGFDLVIPRSRMAREGADVVARLLGA